MPTEQNAPTTTANSVLVAPTTMDLLHFREKDRMQARAHLGGLGGSTTHPKVTADQPSKL